MRIHSLVVLSFAAASSLAAQVPGPGGPGGPPPRGEMRPMAAGAGGPPAAQMLLAHSGELELTDAQVVKLAGIVRRGEGRRKALQASMDSARSRFGQPGDSLARRQFGERMRADFDRAGEQGRVDQRDAIAALTADQQAKAWGMVANRAGGMRAGGAGRMRQQMGGQRGLRGQGGRAGQRQMMRRPFPDGGRPRMRPFMREQMRPQMREPMPAPRPPVDG